MKNKMTKIKNPRDKITSNKDKIINSVAKRIFLKYFKEIPNDKIVTKEMTLEYGEAVALKMVGRFLDLLRFRWRHLLLEKQKVDVEQKDSTHVHGRMNEASYLGQWIRREYEHHGKNIDQLIEYEIKKVKHLKEKKAERIRESKGIKAE